MKENQNVTLKMSGYNAKTINWIKKAPYDEQKAYCTVCITAI